MSVSQDLNSFLTTFPNLAVIGAFWGDEGKGKIVDLCGDQYDIVARFRGGNGAGHTVNVDGKDFAFHSLPSGFARGKTCVLAGGFLLNLKAVDTELRENKKKLTCDPPKVSIDQRCPIWTPYHSLLEAYIEKARGNEAVGTTGRAMGPLQGLYDMREGPIALHLLARDTFTRVVKRLHSMLLPLLVKIGDVPPPSSVAEDLLDVAHASGIINMITDTGAFLFEAITNDKLRVLFEGAQATGLSIDAGTWPYVTSTSGIAGGISGGTLLPPRALSGTILVMKMFPTRVGGGHMPSELSTRNEIQRFADRHPERFEPGEARESFLANRLRHYNSGQATGAELGEYIMVKARELGVSTGRGRSPGRPDAVWARYARRVNDPVCCALNCLDIASGMNEIEVVTGYRKNGEILPPGRIPVLDLHTVEPVIECWPGWKEDITGITSESKLPSTASEFVERLENAIGCPIVIVGTGPERSDFIFRPPNGRLPTFFN